MSEPMHCDFCGKEVASTDDLTIIPVDRFEIPELKYMNLSWAWGGCRECEPLMRQPSWDAPLDRAVAHYPRDEGEFMRPLLARVYLGLREHQNGPLRGWEPALDDREDET